MPAAPQPRPESSAPSAAGSAGPADGTRLGGAADPQVRGPAPAVDRAVAAFLATLGGKSPQTARTYATGLARFQEFLDQEGLPPAAVPTDALPAPILEGFYGWLVRGYGRERRATVMTYLAGARAFAAFLDRRGLLAPETTFEQMRGHLREVVAKASYKTPRIDRALPLIVLAADQLPLPAPGPKYERHRLELLRDRAILHTLFATGMRREEASRLNRQDVDDGWSAQALITGKGEKERIVFFSDEALASLMLNRGAQLSEVQDILGHASPETTKRIYAHYETAHLREAFDRYSASVAELAAGVRRSRVQRSGFKRGASDRGSGREHDRHES
jgi:site-specific recombinase XerD